MSPEVQAHLFEPFFTTKAVGRGTGQGLAQTYGIVTQHGGQIFVQSEEGHGTSVTISLPAATASATELAPAEAVRSHRGSGLVLLVEDEPIVLNSSTKQLQALGYRVCSAANGLEALQVYDQHASEIDIVVSDLVMPEMSAPDLLRELRKRDPEIRMVIASGYPPNAESEDLMAQGGVEWVQKPFSLDALAQALARGYGDRT